MNEKDFESAWEYCSWCDCAMICCPKCGNNCCSGGYGNINGEKCDLCPDAYKYQDKMYQCKKVPCVTTLKGWEERSKQPCFWEEQITKL